MTMIPVRCFSCGKPIGHLWEKFKELVENGMEPAKALDMLDIKRYCCRAVFISHVDLIDLIAVYKKF